MIHSFNRARAWFGLVIVLCASLVSGLAAGLVDESSTTTVPIQGVDPTVANNDAAPNPNAPNQGDYIVVLKPNARLKAVAVKHGLHPHRQYAHALNGFAAHVPDGRLQELTNDPDVLLVEPDVAVFALGQIVPTGVRRIGATLCPIAKIDGLDERVNADVAIIDTGIDLTHPDLNVYQHVSFTTDSTDGNDGHGHGTHVAGTVGALDNSIGVVGVAPGVRLWAVKVLDNTGSGAMSAIIQGVDYVTQHAGEIEVANMSLGGQGSSDSLRLAIQNSVAKGVVYVVAAGNSSFEIYGGDSTLGTSDDFFPAAYPEVMTVSAIGDSDGQAGGTGTSTSYGADDTLATFSNWSATVAVGNPVTSPGAAIDLAAPGVNIYSTYKGGAYATMSGTSMASPHVAGAVALYVAQNGRAYNASGVYAIRQALINSAEPQSSWGINPTTPYANDTKPEGLVNVAGIGSPATVNNPPTVSISSPANNATFDNSVAMTFSASANDVEDGNLTSKIVWSSSLSGQIGTGGTITTKLVVGTHTISAQVVDSAGSVAAAGIKVVVTSTVNTAPNVTITSPANGAIFSTGPTVTFTGSASDLEDGNISSKIAWTYNGATLGTGASTAVAYGNGSFTVVATVTDSGGKQASTSVNFTVGGVQNTAPAVTIQSPANGSSASTASAVQFSGSATDTQDGTISSKIVWNSSINGSLGIGASISATLNAGTHTITANVTDAGGLTSSTTISLTVTNPNTPPTVAITSPASGSTAPSTSPITLTGSASDPQDGSISSKIVWVSSVNGTLGTGASISATLTAGTHTITAKVTDAGGLTSSASITLTVTNPNTAPTVAITSPANGVSLVDIGAIQFSGSASDNQDGTISSKIAWTSSINGNLGTGASISANLTAGAHTIIAKVTDAGGLTSSTSITLTVTDPNTPPNLSILSPVNGALIAQTAGTTLSGSAIDLEDGDISSKIVWSSSIDGALGTGASLTVTLSAGSQFVTASVTDSSGATTSSSVSISVPLSPMIVTLTTDKPSYVHRDVVSMTISVLDSSGSKLAGAAVTVALSTPSRGTLSFQATTDSTGKAVVQYQVNSKRDGTGTYNAKANVSLSGHNPATATATFAVTK